MSLHDSRSPSGADWWGNCPGGPALVEALGITRESGAAADWGTMCHGHAEQAANHVLERGPTPDPILDEAAKEMVKFYVNELFSPEEPLCDCHSKTWDCGVEERGASRHLPHASGTIDFRASCHKHGWIRIVDLKTGHNEVEAVDNPQCAIYGLHALLAAKVPVHKIVIEIIQPRSPSGRKVKRWTLRPIELLDLLPVFQDKIKASMTPGSPLVAGEKQCRYCPAAPVCSERRKGVTRSAALQFGVGKKNSPEDVAEALILVPQLKDWVKSVESFAYQEANRGVKIPGFKLVQKRDGNRKWTDEDVTIAALTPECRDSTDMFSTELRSPAVLEKIFGKEKINALCTREPGGTVLVEDTDDRPAVVVDKLATFQGLLAKT